MNQPGVKINNDPSQAMAERLKKAIAGVKEQSVTVSSSGLLGRLDIKFVQSDTKNLSAAFREGTEYALSVAQEALREALDAAVASSVWQWNEGGSRDIVDTGALRSSLSVSIDGQEITIDYGVPYAAFVHYGGYVKPYGNAKIEAVYIPGRPWIDSVLFGTGPVPALNLDRIILDAIDSKLR